ncbi:MAG: hypothetical protein FRX48_00395 [Lasallia pustulata]|uniref:UBX domain-containing protein n=1 Tax=Lasallia pustulata TaxID=136370 RepID=A0A5M8Q2T0_9LECA|nr:MAG: hypothetical protein FRX48_00395 [Lasallia pustulata]
MASHVVVIDSTARRAMIKTAPGKHLSDVLQEACTKFGLNASQYGLKNNNKQVDISRTFRLSGLSSGAKLELVLLSRSPSVVSVALQLPDSEAQGVPNSRLTDKFPSTTTLWLLLRKFESSAASNFTARGAPKTGSGESGAGRLFYERPVLQVMGRELSSFTDLQKTLAQLGFNSGSVLLRLSFKTSETPLEEAMGEIDQYFKSVEGEQAGSSRGAHAGSAAQAESMPEASQPALPKDDSPPHSPPEPSSLPSSSTTPHNPSTPPKSKAPPLLPLNLSPSLPALPTHPPPPHLPDYIPTLDHAKQHQSLLSASSRNKRLATDAELLAQQTAQARKRAEIKDVEIKIRFPDQTQVVSRFSNADAASDLYGFVQGLLEHPDEPFSLSFAGPGGMRGVPKGETVGLIRELGMVGRVLVNFNWEEGASMGARAGCAVKEEWRREAREIEVREVEWEVGEAEGGGEEGGGEGGEGGGVPRWLKLPGRK